MKQEPVNNRVPLSQARRVVVKLGTGLLCGARGQFNQSRMESLVSDLALLKQERQLVLVSSGAIGAGVGRLGLARRPRTIPEKQAAAAVGQCVLMQQYERLFSPRGLIVAQVLLTRYDIMDRERYLNASYTFEALLSQGVVPVVNENDTVAVEEIRFGDNDNLAAHVACLVDADLVILLTDQDGFYKQIPSPGRAGELIPDCRDHSGDRGPGRRPRLHPGYRRHGDQNSGSPDYHDGWDSPGDRQWPEGGHYPAGGERGGGGHSVYAGRWQDAVAQALDRLQFSGPGLDLRRPGRRRCYLE
jgi:isopentenyl phosphate kinase